MGKEAYFVGIDVGTQGVRVVLLNLEGALLFDDGWVFQLNEQSRQEQSPEEWWNCCSELLQRMVVTVRGKIDLENIKAIGVTSTSGTVIPLDAENKPLHNALMYSDKRSEEVSKICTLAASRYYNDSFNTFNSSSGLAKMLWFIQSYPDKAKKIAKWIHAADYITGKLSGNWGITDYTNAFKSGYDVNELKWPSYISTEIGINEAWLPKVEPLGTVIGNLDHLQADLLGLNIDTLVTVGITDGCASQIAAGAIKPGDWNTTIGTTLVIKGVTQKQIVDVKGRIYSHRHAVDGLWMPGGASNTGADWVSAQFANEDLAQLNKSAEQLIPTGKIVYPLMQQGERFPMLSPQAVGFGMDNLNKEEKFAAAMEGVAYLERYAYELLEELSDEKVGIVYTAGGASNSDVWLKIRSSVLNKKIVKMKYVSGGVGAAILAASKTHFDSIIDAVAQLTTIEKEVKPDLELSKKYQEGYHQFLQQLLDRKFITEEEVYA
ncbi:MAG: FGGY-family carbohydrate kinase [Pedobacter sp.]|uniref:FGGY-family carbohydrate kinase n=1 Tax=Pedobacter sp. TaxID=1411316 RepID=UPI0028089161|nr:FGGY-family carbohydrate kinase [Pedobacter sp.]MDQ8005545.1 FGGY-family carbohydrate kinase [Pedobacter sp.]